MVLAAPKEGAKVLMFADANFLAHVSRVLEIGKVLRDCYGCDVRYAGDGPYLKFIRDAGFKIEYCYTVPKATTLELVRRASLGNPFWWHKTVMRSIDSDVQAIRNFNPDMVVGDMHWTLKASAVECKVPYVSIVNGAWTKYLDYTIEAFDDHFLTSMLGRKRATSALPALKRSLLTFWALPYIMWKVMEGHGGVNVRSIYEILEGDLTLMADIPEFCPTANLPESVKYIGPILWEAPMPAPDWLKRLDPSRPVIYITMGSTGKKEFFEAGRKAFENTKYQVVMTCGEIDFSGERVPDNFFITDFAPGLAILKHSDLVVNHGGNGTIYQALTAGVPIAGIPTHIDQQIQLQLCERIRVGLKLREKVLSPELLRNVADEIIADPSYRVNARQVGWILAKCDGARTGAAEIIEFMRKRMSSAASLSKAC